MSDTGVESQNGTVVGAPLDAWRLIPRVSGPLVFVLFLVRFDDRRTGEGVGVDLFD